MKIRYHEQPALPESNVGFIMFAFYQSVLALLQLRPTPRGIATAGKTRAFTLDKAACADELHPDKV